MKTRITYAALVLTAGAAGGYLVYVVLSIVESTIKLLELGGTAWQ